MSERDSFRNNSNESIESSSNDASIKLLSDASESDPTDAVRVWWGYKRPEVSNQSFDNSLGNVFIPVTVQQMSPLGLESYLPAVLPEDKPSSVPDEIAIVFYKDQNTYQNSRATVYGREYQLLHRALFNFDKKNGEVSTSDFPALFEDKLEPGKPYSLFPKLDTDWQSGTAKLYVGVPLDGQSREQYMDSIKSVLQEIQTHPNPNLDGVIVRVSDKFITYWEHYNNKDNSDGKNMDALSKITKSVMRHDSADLVTIPLDGNTKFAGLAVKDGSFYNLQFPH